MKNAFNCNQKKWIYAIDPSVSVVLRMGRISNYKYVERTRMPPVGLYIIIIIIMHVLSHQSERVCAASSGHFSRDHSRFAAVPLPIGNWPYVLTHERSLPLPW